MEKLHIYRPLWFKVPEKFSFKEENSEPVFHPFFDLLPSYNFKEKSINFVPLTKMNSKYSYDLDLVSGKKFRKHIFCRQDDIWQSFPGEIHKPPFTAGIIPRILDQWARPQKIIVFGKESRRRSKKDFEMNKLKKTIYLKEAKKPFERARIIGGVIIQYCKNYPCNINQKWLSRWILVGVYPDDFRMENIYTIKELKKHVNWDKVKAFLENGEGKNVAFPSKIKPAYRYLRELRQDVAVNFSFKNGHIFNAKELMAMRKSCHAIYDYMWNSSLLIRANYSVWEQKNLAKKLGWSRRKFEPKKYYQREYDLKNLRKKIALFTTDINKTINKDLDVDLDKDLYGNFKDFFMHFYQNYHEKYLTCVKYVRSSNVNYDSDRHWYLEFISAFLLLKEMDFVFYCKTEAWIKNPFNSAKNANDYDFFEQLSECSFKQLNIAFERAVVLLQTLGHNKVDTYRYITYDFGTGGSHQKIYSWVPFFGKRLVCKDSDQQEKRNLAKKQRSFFPDDVSWDRFKNPEHLKEKEEFIELE